mgnify:FL=1
MEFLKRTDALSNACDFQHPEGWDSSLLIIFHRATDNCLGREIGMTTSKRELKMMMMVKTTLLSGCPILW